MRIKDGFKLREICGLWVITPEGVGNIDYSEIISLNESAALMWREAEGKEFSVEDLTKTLTDNYEIDTETARHDAAETLELWQNKGLVE